MEGYNGVCEDGEGGGSSGGNDTGVAGGGESGGGGQRGREDLWDQQHVPASRRSAGAGIAGGKSGDLPVARLAVRRHDRKGGPEPRGGGGLLPHRSEGRGHIH